MANKPIFEILDAEFWILYIYMLRKNNIYLENMELYKTLISSQ